MITGLKALAALSTLSLLTPSNGDPEYVAGYLIIPVSEGIPKTYGAGFSMYVPVWPLERIYPGHQYETGLPGTWMFAQYDGDAPKDLYSDVEGGLGWWTDTRFPSAAPKFIMGGVGPNFSEIANGPGHGAGSWKDPKGLYGVVQLSPWLLFPPDGLNLKEGPRGELLGYGYLNLPLLSPKTTTDGKPVPTGGNCWTLFLSSKNFKGPVAFFTPHFWSHNGIKEPRLAGQLLDSRPADPNTAIQMETHYIACRVTKDSKGDSYARIAPTSFPANSAEGSVLVADSTAYSSAALWNSVSDWFHGGKPCSGQVDPKGAFSRTFTGPGYATWEVRIPGPNGSEEKVPLDWDAFARPAVFDAYTYGYRWDSGFGSQSDGLRTLPEYYKLGSDSKGKPIWVPVAADSVPSETGLRNIRWSTPAEQPQEPYSAPVDTDPSWRNPGPQAGPFKVHLGDGTGVTYYWYRFADQPALQHAGLDKKEREALQQRVEKLHRSWPKSRDYLKPPRAGKLAEIDPVLLVKPPKGMEFGFVPIATRQDLAITAKH
jgi:hypothetical protein